MKKLLLCAAVVAVSLMLPPLLRAESLTFFGNGSWDSPGLWYRLSGTPPVYTVANKVPTSDDDAIIGGGAVCNAAGPLRSVKSLTILLTSTVNGGQFDTSLLDFETNSAPGSGSVLTVNGANFNIRSSGTAKFNVPNISINNSVLHLNGFATAIVNIGVGFSGSTILNEGSFVIQGTSGSGPAVSFSGSNNRFDNIGEIRGNGGNSQFNAGFQNLTLNNQGTIRADSGTLVINGNMIWAADDGDGSFYPATSDAVINIQGNFVVPAAKTFYFKGPGNVITSSTVTINGTLSIGVPASGAVYDDPHIRAAGVPAQPGNWLIKTSTPISLGFSTAGIKIEDGSKAILGVNYFTGNASTGTVQVMPGGELDINGGSNNGQDFVTSGGADWIILGGVFINVRQLELTQTDIVNSGHIKFLAPAGVINSGSPVSTFTNQGVVDMIGSNVQNPLTGLGVVFNQSAGATLNITGSSAFSFYGGGTISGVVNGTPDLPVRFANGNFVFKDGLDFQSSFVVFAAPAELKNATPEQIHKWEIDNGAIVRGNGTVALATTLNWTGGTIQAPAKVIFNPGSIATMSGSGIITLDGGTIFNSGTVNWTGSVQVNAINGANWNNLTGSIFNMQSDSSLNGDSSATFLNNPGATVEKTAGTGRSSFGGSFFNIGNVVAASGTLAFCSFQQPGGLPQRPFNVPADAVFTGFGHDLAANTLTEVWETPDGKVFIIDTDLPGTLLIGGSLLMTCNQPLNMNAGLLYGSGTLTGSATLGVDTKVGPVIISPGILPAPPPSIDGVSGTAAASSTTIGTLTITGNYTQGPNATLNIEVAGVTTPGTDYDLLSIGGTAALGGALHVTDINGFTPSPKDTIVPLTAKSITGKFDSTNAQVNYGLTSLTVAALPTAAAQLLNISTRMEVLTGSNVLIGGFIVTGTDQKKVLVRGLGPSLPLGSADLADPTLELHDSSKTLQTNDNWQETQASDIQATGIPPSNQLESALVATLPANNSAYTAILSGKNGGTGVGLVEIYDLAQAANSKLANISTRGFIDTGDNVMIGGLILGPNGTGAAKILVRGLGPSLSNAGVANALQDPVLEVHDATGATVATNDNWKVSDTGGSQQTDIEATTIPPTDDRESALVRTLSPGNYTAIVRGKAGTTGVGLVELYNLGSP